MKQAILVRVGIDQSPESGAWNAPCNPSTGDFVYVPIKQTADNVPGMEKRYADLMVPALEKFSQRNSCNISLPARLRNRRLHLDPDFDYLSYGDTCKRGKKLASFKEDDLVVFFAAFKSATITEKRLIYALIGLLTVEKVVRVKDIPASKRDRNAHTRLLKPTDSDIVVTGKTGGDKSGRLVRCIPIGEYRNRAYRVKKSLLEEWGDLKVKDGYIHRSANPPLFRDPDRFHNWLQKQNPQLIQANNLATP